MPSNADSYEKTLEDELDWKLLDQLHHVVSQISGFCFETKKFCVTTEFVVLAFVVKFTSNKLDRSVFVVALIIPVCFWFLDAVAYYYQAKLRGTMDAIRDRLRSRQSKHIVGTPSTPTIDRGARFIRTYKSNLSRRL